MTRRPRWNLMRSRDGSERVTNVELFFDLVYVFAVTQLSHYLLNQPSPEGGLRTGLLLTMVWLVWAYTTWVTNWLDPERIAVRLLLLALVPASLVMSAALPDAFGARGLAVGGAYAAMQIGRSAFAVVALDGQPLQRNYQRILAWCVVSGALAILGGLKAGHARELLWLGAVAVDLVGGAAGFYTPGLGRSSTADWTIEGGHFAVHRRARRVQGGHLGPDFVAEGRRDRRSRPAGPAGPARVRADNRWLRRRRGRRGRRCRPIGSRPTRRCGPPNNAGGQALAGCWTSRSAARSALPSPSRAPAPMRLRSSPVSSGFSRTSAPRRGLR